MANLKLTGLHKYYGAMHAVRGVDLDIAEGEFAVLVGPSGCGKSTLLRAIAGLEEIDAGTVEIGGEVVNDVRPRDRNVAMVFQNYALYPYLTVFENIAFGLRARVEGDERFLRSRVTALGATLTEIFTEAAGRDESPLHAARRRVERAKQLLEEIGLEPERLEMFNLSSAEGIRFAEIVTEMTDRLARLGPSPLRPDRAKTEQHVEEMARQAEAALTGEQE